MGRITIFTLDNSPNCILAKKMLMDRNIPFLEISLTKHPQKRNDMISLSGKLTVPQLFINSAYVGGLSGTKRLLNGWEKDGMCPLQTYKALVAEASDPQDPRLAPSTLPPITPMQSLPREMNVIAIPRRTPDQKPQQRRSVLEVMEILKQIVYRRDLKYNLTTYKNSFRGSELVDALRDHFLISREGAVEFAEQLYHDHHMLHHVVNEHDFADTPSLFFRLHCDQTPNVLNSYRMWTERVDPDPMSLLRRLKKQLGKILKDCTDSEERVDYKQASNHNHFPAFEEAACELQGVKLVEMQHDTKLAFCINLYNLMIKYAFVKVGIASSQMGRNAFFNSVGFVLGGHFLTFQDMEHGILRGNRKAPYAASRQFGPNDDRLDLVFSEVDIRIHFALNCGARSCPQILDFTSYGVHEELRVAALEFCDDDENFSIQGNTIHLSKIFSWYSEDFGSTSTEILQKILRFCRASKALGLKTLLDHGGFRIKYNPYDWSTDASDFLRFSADGVKADSSRFL
ncbi:glutaredoxin [Nitzschia inconspicua]|uniref:Glutaredoxin n=1 Tax=Nitzschia inconspicua TaxID=303405 RepID=A0A9K3KGJ4_9STRA|nr:glutaredoxin [Nitzschia inconspicua]